MIKTLKSLRLAAAYRAARGSLWVNEPDRSWQRDPGIRQHVHGNPRGSVSCGGYWTPRLWHSNRRATVSQRQRLPPMPRLASSSLSVKCLFYDIRPWCLAICNVPDLVIERSKLCSSIFVILTQRARLSCEMPAEESTRLPFLCRRWKISI